jgi:hypothetical protein
MLDPNGKGRGKTSPGSGHSRAPPGFRTRISVLPVFRLGEVGDILDLRSRSFHGHPGATTSGPTTGVTGGIFFGWPSKRLTHRWSQRLSSLRKTGHVLVLVCSFDGSYNSPLLPVGVQTIRHTQVVTSESAAPL